MKHKRNKRECIYCNNEFYPRNIKHEICDECHKPKSCIYNCGEQVMTVGKFICRKCRRPAKEKQEIILCGCGCGEHCKITGSKFRAGHNNRGIFNPGYNKIGKAGYRYRHDVLYFGKDRSKIIEWSTKNEADPDFIASIWFNPCALCGWDKAKCDIHHIIPKKLGGKGNSDNLMVLCRNCHQLEQLRINKTNIEGELLNSRILEFDKFMEEKC